MTSVLQSPATPMGNVVNYFNGTNVTRHVGMNSRTGSRVVVIFPFLPEEMESALIVEPDALPQRYRDPLMNILNSGEGNQVDQLYEALHRNRMPDSGNPMLVELHYGGFMHKVPGLISC